VSILTRLFGSKNQPTTTGDQTPTARSLLKARTPPWHRVAPIVIDAIFESLADTELFDCFVLASMEKKLVVRYEELGREDENVSVIRAEISGILCQAGFREIASLEKEMSNRRIDAARKIGFAATNLFEPAIAMSKDQIAGYIGMATIYALLGVKAQCHEYAKRGLFELQKVRQSAAGQAMLRDSAVFPPDMLDQAERQLLGYLEGTLDHPERATAAPPSHARDNTTRIGRRGICMLCGTIKSGSYVACEECGFQPISNEELTIAVMLNEASVRNFEQIANAIRSGQLPEFTDKDIQKFIGTAAEARRTTGPGGPQYFTRAKTESLLTLSVQVAAQGMSNTIAKIVPGELIELSKERMLAVLGGMIKSELIRRAPVSERDFIKRFFGKRLVLMSMQSRFPSLAGTAKDEFARRVEQAILDFDARAFDVSGNKHSLERTSYHSSCQTWTPFVTT
jgi:hypothetical protein